jgi:hypothetical protein
MLIMFPCGEVKREVNVKEAESWVAKAEWPANLRGEKINRNERYATARVFRYGRPAQVAGQAE